MHPISTFSLFLRRLSIATKPPTSPPPTAEGRFTGSTAMLISEVSSGLLSPTAGTLPSLSLSLSLCHSTVKSNPPLCLFSLSLPSSRRCSLLPLPSSCSYECSHSNISETKDNEGRGKCRSDDPFHNNPFRLNHCKTHRRQAPLSLSLSLTTIAQRPINDFIEDPSMGDGGRRIVGAAALVYSTHIKVAFL
ncbi:unnamed protein product [Camellia sinensis]